MFPLADLERLARQDVDNRRSRREIEGKPDRHGAVVGVGSDRDGENAGQGEQQFDAAVIIGCQGRRSVQAVYFLSVRWLTKVALFRVDERVIVIQDREGLLSDFVSARILRDSEWSAA